VGISHACAFSDRTEKTIFFQNKLTQKKICMYVSINGKCLAHVFLNPLPFPPCGWCMYATCIHFHSSHHYLELNIRFKCIIMWTKSNFGYVFFCQLTMTPISFLHCILIKIYRTWTSRHDGMWTYTSYHPPHHRVSSHFHHLLALPTKARILCLDSL